MMGRGCGYEAFNTFSFFFSLTFSFLKLCSNKSSIQLVLVGELGKFECALTLVSPPHSLKLFGTTTNWQCDLALLRLGFLTCDIKILSGL